MVTPSAVKTARGESPDHKMLCVDSNGRTTPRCQRNYKRTDTQCVQPVDERFSTTACFSHHWAEVRGA
jgi:hypothetical protein